MRYSYMAREAGGGEVEGYVDAASEQDALRKLTRDGLDVLRLDAEDRRARAGGSASKPANTSQLTPAFRELSTLLAGGVSLVDAVSAVGASAANPRVALVFEGVEQRLRDGSRFSDALRKEAPSLPPAVIVLIEAGEASGDIAGAAQAAVDSLATQAQLRGEIVNALIYPAILATAGLGAVTFILAVVVPRFATALSDRIEELPAVSRAMFALSTVINENGLVIVGAVALLGVGVWRFFASAAMRARVYDGLLYVPLARDWLISAEAARWSSLMAALATRKVAILDALSLARSGMASGRIKRQLRQVERAVRRGQPLGESLRTYTLMPAALANLASAGEASGDLGGALTAAAEMYREHVRNAAKRFLTILEPATILLISLFVALIAVAMVSAITSVNQVTL